jgi:hypothetical protein
MNRSKHMTGKALLEPLCKWRTDTNLRVSARWPSSARRVGGGEGESLVDGTSALSGSIGSTFGPGLPA